VKKIFAILVLFACIILSGCTQNQPPDYSKMQMAPQPMIEVDLHPHCFNMSGAVARNGSVANYTSFTCQLIVKNVGNTIVKNIDVSFDNFPSELQVWSTSMLAVQGELMTTYLIENGVLYHFIYTSIGQNSTLTFNISLIFRQSPDWTYSDSMTYVGRFKVWYENEDFVKSKVVSFTVRT
jgi:hypothetical protein